MKKFEDTKVKTPVEIICDCCGRKAKIDDDDFESQEFVSIDFVGGYKSIFGDGTQVSLDIREISYLLLAKYIAHCSEVARRSNQQSQVVYSGIA